MTKVSKVDEKGGWVCFPGWTETPLERHLYGVPLEGGNVELGLALGAGDEVHR